MTIKYNDTLNIYTLEDVHLKLGLVETSQDYVLLYKGLLLTHVGKDWLRSPDGREWRGEQQEKWSR